MVIEQNQAIFWTTANPILAQIFDWINQFIVQEPTIEKNNTKGYIQLDCTLNQFGGQTGFGAIHLFPHMKDQ